MNSHSFGQKNNLGEKVFEIGQFLRGPIKRQSFSIQHAYVGLVETAKLTFFKFFTLNNIFICKIINPHKKLDLLRYIFLL